MYDRTNDKYLLVICIASFGFFFRHDYYCNVDFKVFRLIS